MYVVNDKLLRDCCHSDDPDLACPGKCPEIALVERQSYYITS